MNVLCIEKHNYNQDIVSQGRVVLKGPWVRPRPMTTAMIGENRQIVTSEPVEFEK